MLNPTNEPTSRSAVRRSDRFSAILDTLSRTGAVHVDELAAQFNVSTATLRRDLALLEERRLLTRTHGGALAQNVSYHLPVRQHDTRLADHRRIAVEAGSRVPGGHHVVGLTGGVLTGELAHLLADRADLTVVTNALNIAAELALRPRLKLVVTGGVTRPGSYELTGPWAEHTLTGVNIGTAFVCAEGVDPEVGLTTNDEIEARTNFAMLERAQRVIALVPGDTFGQLMLAHIAPVKSVHEIITDRSADPAVCEALRAAGVVVTVVGGLDDTDEAVHPAGQPFFS